MKLFLLELCQSFQSCLTLQPHEPSMDSRSRILEWVVCQAPPPGDLKPTQDQNPRVSYISCINRQFLCIFLVYKYLDPLLHTRRCNSRHWTELIPDRTGIVVIGDMIFWNHNIGLANFWIKIKYSLSKLHSSWI